MAASEPSGGGGNIEVCPWLKSMPVAPEYHPTPAEFQDPIAYIFKIEKEASKFGICKIVPPVASAPKKTILSNFNKSLLARSNDPTFTTRQQQIGFCPRKHRPVQKPVWQSGERYTLSEFEAKAKNFEKNYLKKYHKKTLNPLELETLYWNATVDKPFAVEYANDMPGSAFAVRKSGGRKGGEGAMTVGDTEWNMRGVSRANTSLLKFMKEEIPGVTSPMVYIAMMFSWFAWHVEDHDLHSLNYLHMGSSKTWYGVPKDAAVAFEEVVREHGYAGEINPLVMFSKLGEKTTVMSPEVLLSAGVPCCRLVQNAGDFVVTFPRAYHSGFSHGFNCGEASNIATPEWLRVAKEAAIRRASINCPPMVSHFQLLYDLALSLCSRVPKNISTEPRSSRLKNRKKSEGETLIKEMFLQDMMQNNKMLHELGKGTSVLLLSQNSLSSSVYSDSRTGQHLSAKSRLFPSLCNPDHEFMTTKYNARDDFMRERKQGMKQAEDYTVSGKFSSRSGNNTEQPDSNAKRNSQTEQGLFSCVACGILCFSCVAILQPTEAASHHLMSADCSIFDDLGVSGNEHNYASDTNAPTMNPYSVLELLKTQDGRYSVPMSSGYGVRDLGEASLGTAPNSKVSKGPSSLGLLALAYGDSSDTEGDEAEADIPSKGCGTSESNSENGLDFRDSQSFDGTDEFRTNNCTLVEPNSLTRRFEHQKQDNFHSMTVSNKTDATIGNALTPLENRSRSFSSRSDEDSSRLHVFCLQHAVEVEKRLSSIGGADVFLVCHPDYPKLEFEVKKVAEEFESDHCWNEVPFRDATDEDEDLIQLALNSENAIHGNADWAVKLGINLFYSANLSRSPLYCKQMPYNYVMYSAFGRGSPNEHHTVNIESEGKGSSRQRKIIVAGKWCGKVWMSNQVHPLLVKKDLDEEEQEYGVSSGIKPDLTYQRRSGGSRSVATPRPPTVSKTSRKRKNTRGNGSFVKERSVDTLTMEEPSQDFTPYSRKKINRKRGTKQPKKETHVAEHIDESSEEVEHISSFKKVKGKRGTNPLKKEFLPVNENSEESSGEFPLTNSWKPVNSRNGPSRMETENHEAELSDESLEEIETQSRHGTKRLKDEDPDSENSEDASEEIPLTNSWNQKTKARRTERATPAPRVKTPKAKQQFDLLTDDDDDDDDDDELVGGPSTRLRKRAKKPCKDSVTKLAKVKPVPKQQQKGKAVKKGKASTVSNKASMMDEETEYQCDMDGCTMSYSSKHELTLHKRNICPVKGCGKKFFSHKYLVQHRRVHEDDRPLKCPWKGCKMTFKWAWARTEHIRVHTGARPYVCTQAGCGQTFRFVSDFSRHKRKTGHAPKKSRGG